MVLHATREDCGAIELPRDPGQVTMKIRAKAFVREMRNPRFRRKDHVEVNGGEGLCHWGCRGSSIRSCGLAAMR